MVSIEAVRNARRSPTVFITGRMRMLGPKGRGIKAALTSRVFGRIRN